MQHLIHFIADYAPGDLAISEVYAALAGHITEPFVCPLTSVHSFDTVSTGFAVAQLGRQRPQLRPQNTLLYANCAPRKDRREARSNNEGEGFVYAVLDSGVTVLAVNAGYTMSFVRENIEDFWSVAVDTGGSQFRSRDNFPIIVGKAVRGELDFKKDRLDPLRTIPERPKSVVGYVDSFGNLKTTIREGDPELQSLGLAPGQRIIITINDVKMAATVASGSFNVQEGDIAFSPGSSGHTQKYWEIFQRGGSAWHTYKKPRAGSGITISVL